MNNINKNRIKKEMEMLSCSPPAGISCSPTNDQLDLLSAQIIGQEGTPFEGGVFHLEIQVPDRYPFDPPRVRFMTPIYHPNIDTNGRICLDTLKLPPKGTWRPCLNISTVLMMIRILMAEPGSEDPLMTAIWQEYKYDYTMYVEKARQWTQKYATDSLVKKSNLPASAVSTVCQDTKTTAPKEVVPSGSDVTNPKVNPSRADSDHQPLLSSPGPKVNPDLTKNKPTKGLGLACKRPALGEFDTNTKVSKTS